MHAEPKKRHPILFTLLSIAIVIITAAITTTLLYFFMPQNNNQSKETNSVFSFTGTPDWRQGPTNETSMALFGPRDDDQTSACFVSIQYKDGTVDIQKELKKQQDMFTSDGGSMTQIAVTPVTLPTVRGAESYDLYQYDIVSPDTQILHGLALGYIQLRDNYVKVDAHCETAVELTTAIPALQAYRLDK